MKLEITRNVKQTETIEIEFPYYYKCDLMLDDVDSVIYGKIEEKRHTKIQVSFDYRSSERRFEFVIEQRAAETLGCYMTKEYKSSEVDYLNAKAELLSADMNLGTQQLTLGE